MQIRVKVDCPECSEAVDVEIRVTSSGSPGRYNGPPEDCYPAEGAEWEIVHDAETCERCGRIVPADYSAEAMDPQDVAFAIADAEEDRRDAGYDRSDEYRDEMLGGW